MSTNILKLEGEVVDRNAKGWKVEGEKRRVTRKACEILRDEFEDGGFHGAERALEHHHKEDVTRGGWK